MTASDRERLVASGIRASVAAQERLLGAEHVGAVVRAADIVSAALRAGRKLLVFGNGGSAADATHIAAEFLGRFLLDRPALPAVSLTDNASALTAIGNDFDFREVFARQIAGLGQRGDVALALSTSGDSENVVRGVAAAHERGLRTIALAGRTGGRLRAVAELCIAVPADSTPRIQEAQFLVAHLLCELVERDVAGDGRAQR